MFGNATGPYFLPFDEWPKELQDQYRYDPEKAEQLLDEAGYPHGADGVRFRATYDHRDVIDLGLAEIAAGSRPSAPLLMALRTDLIAGTATVRDSIACAIGWKRPVRRSVTNQVVEFHVQHLGDRRQCRNGTGARRSLDLREIERADAGGLCHLLLRHAPVFPVHANRTLAGNDSVNDGDRKRLLVLVDRSIEKRFIRQVIVGNLATGEALVVLPTNHGKGWAPCIIADHLRVGHHSPYRLYKSPRLPMRSTSMVRAASSRS